MCKRDRFDNQERNLIVNPVCKRTLSLLCELPIFIFYTVKVSRLKQTEFACTETLFINYFIIRAICQPLFKNFSPKFCLSSYQSYSALVHITIKCSCSYRDRAVNKIILNATNIRVHVYRSNAIKAVKALSKKF